MIDDKRVFITGGAGFIGSRIAEKLLPTNHVVVFDNLTRDSLSNTGLVDHPHLSIVEGDILDPDQLAREMSGSDLVIHCAAIAGVDSVIRSPVNTIKVNLVGSANVLAAAANLKACTRVLVFSTSEVFGQYAFRVDETHDTVIGEVGEARWTYAVSKLAAEHLALAYFREQGLPVVVLRPFNIYGPGQVGEGALRAFVNRAIRDEPIEIHGDGTQIRAWCYIDDLVDAVMRCLVDDRAIGESFNIGNQRAVTTIYGLASTVVRVLGSPSEIRFVQKHYSDVELRVPSVKKAHELLDFVAEVDLEEGIRRTADYYRASR